MEEFSGLSPSLPEGGAKDEGRTAGVSGSVMHLQIMYTRYVLSNCRLCV